MKLVLAEKPSVAQSIAKVLGAAKREDGYLEGKSSCLFYVSSPSMCQIAFSDRLFLFVTYQRKFSCRVCSNCLFRI